MAETPPARSATHWGSPVISDEGSRAIEAAHAEADRHEIDLPGLLEHPPPRPRDDRRGTHVGLVAEPSTSERQRDRHARRSLARHRRTVTRVRQKAIRIVTELVHTASELGEAPVGWVTPA